MNWLKEQWGALAFLTIFAIGTLLIALTPPEPIQAAAPAVPPCTAINQAGAITVYRCEPDAGPSFLINSVGFMAVEE